MVLKYRLQVQVQTIAIIYFGSIFECADLKHCKLQLVREEIS